MKQLFTPFGFIMVALIVLGTVTIRDMAEAHRLRGPWASSPVLTKRATAELYRKADAPCPGYENADIRVAKKRGPDG